MTNVKWIKITTDMFDDDKIDFIESLPDADTILIIWIKLLTLAGKCNADGYIVLADKIPYTPEMLSHKFRRPLNSIKFALETFSKLGMVQIDEDGISITNWLKHQNADGLEKIREDNRLRKQRERERKKLLIESEKDKCHVTCHVTESVTCHDDVTHSSYSISNSNSLSNKDKVTKKRKEEAVKIQYADSVLMTEKEYETLLKNHGEEYTKKFIEKLDNYKGATGKTYKSDYKAILNWVVDEVKGKKEVVITSATTGQKSFEMPDWI